MRVEAVLAAVLIACAFLMCGMGPGPREEPGEPVLRQKPPEPPSREMLDFLARFQGADGKWIDPMAIKTFLVPDPVEADHD